MQPMQILFGAILLGLGLWGVYDEYFVVVEFIKGILQPATGVIGLVALIAGLTRRELSIPHVVFGILLLCLTVYGFYDEYYAVLDFVKGALPLAMVGIGTVAVASGIGRLRAS